MDSFSPESKLLPLQCGFAYAVLLSNYDGQFVWERFLGSSLQRTTAVAIAASAALMQLLPLLLPMACSPPVHLFLILIVCLSLSLPLSVFAWQADAVAIVLSPKHHPNSGVFHCTALGMKALTGCKRNGFHKHEEPYALFRQAAHHCWDNDPKKKAIFIDLRIVPPQGQPHAHAQQQPPSQQQQQQQQQPQYQQHQHTHGGHTH